MKLQDILDRIMEADALAPSEDSDRNLKPKNKMEQVFKTRAVKADIKRRLKK